MTKDLTWWQDPVPGFAQLTLNAQPHGAACNTYMPILACKNVCRNTCVLLQIDSSHRFCGAVCTKCSQANPGSQHQSLACKVPLQVAQPVQVSADTVIRQMLSCRMHKMLSGAQWRLTPKSRALSSSATTFPGSLSLWHQGVPSSGLSLCMEIS